MVTLSSSVAVAMTIYRLDAKTKGSMRFRIPTALSCSVPSKGPEEERQFA